MEVLIVDNDTSYIRSLENIVCSNEYVIIKWDKLKFSQINSYDLIILSGGHPNSVKYHHELYKEEIKTILRSDIPILGICFGFELIVYAFGGKLKELSSKEKGVLEIEATGEDEILVGIKKIKVFESHRWIAESLPPELLALAVSKDGIEIVKHVSRFIYGFQFHPEIVVDGNDLIVFNNLLKKAKE